ncbi:winged helix-turn-helix domain-containing protein [Halomonas daqiaonensis]|uniref:AAA ATPase domain-containing protein n=1 Tax=Halomonas daqiaonensis TaxID=650850 RepID=A0A1H7Q7M5_9GAMM|nr:winged helix-turn-helix domain-containing protein [Halomonas daqiaonensis]SEL43993.1 AAA ATPase domain-containing protein [Halomonas daqiaonensis]
MAGLERWVPGPAGTLAGREAELEQLLTLLDEAGPRVMWVHGVAGIGKSVLVGRFVHNAERGGVRCLFLEGGSIEPTPEGFLTALGEAVQTRLETLPDLEGLLEGLLEGQQRRLLIIAVDGVEALHLLDTWLRSSLVPQLPDGVRLLLSGRHRPATRWHGGPEGRGVRVLSMAPLAISDATRLLESLGFSGAQATALARRLHGNPLAIQLAAATLPARPGFRLPEASLQQLMDALTELYLADITDPLQRRLLEGASVVRRITEPLLEAMFPEVSPDDAYARLRTLDLVEALPDGLGLHEMVREALERSFLARDPQRHGRYRRRAWQALARQVAGSGRSELWRYTADLLYLVENPVVREAFFPSDRPELVVEPAHPGDVPTLQDIIHRHEGPEGARALWRWWQAMPEAFFVVRDTGGRCQGLCCRFDPHQASPRCLAEDPVTAAWCKALKASPLPDGERVLFIRRWLGRDDGERPGEVQAACWLALKRDYMEMRPALRRVYLVLSDLSPYAAVAETLGFRPLPTRVTLDGVEHASAMLDFGPRSVDGWLARLAAAELGLEGATEWLDRQAHELIHHDRRIALTPLEFGVLTYLLDREGEAVSRERLLQEVWQSDYTGWSNKVDAVVVGLRRKLRDEAGRIETVTGVGYRYRHGDLCPPDL